jgi:cysteinyl-tRNA synthetase
MLLTDTLTNSRVELTPPLADDGVVRLYVCGVTPYSESHVGHAVFMVVFDVLRRYLEWRGVPVRHVQNFTDVDDKLIDRSQRLGVAMSDLADQMIADYMVQLDEMNVLRATEYPRVSEVIPAIVEFIRTLIDKGFAYESGGDVYYSVRTFGGERYGALSKRDVDDLLSGARVDPTELKADPLDFALWKTAKPGEPHWPSPWGDGRPGWHIECSAMSLGALGEQIDIHGGGADLIFPHHTNEIAQTEAYTGKTPFARIWMHNALLQLGEEKMSKSLGNIVSIAGALEQYGADALRLFVINSHYRSPATYTDEAMDAARAGATRLREAAHSIVPPQLLSPAVDPEPVRARFIAAMEDDLNTPQALAALFDLSRELNRARDRGRDIRDAQDTLRELAGVLGLTLEAPAQAPQERAPFIALMIDIRGTASVPAEGEGATDVIEALIDMRREYRANRQWELADRVRNGLAALNIELKDSPEGTSWAVK